MFKSIPLVEISTTPKNIYIISGTLGAGKSSFSKLISSNLGYALVDGDSLFNPLENLPELSWDDRLKITWTNIANITTEYLKNNLNVVIDFVVEDELAWFLKEINSYKPKVKYCQLIADEKTLASRLKMRDGGTQYLERSLKLLNKIQNDPDNQKYLIDTTGKSPDEIFEIFVSSERFLVK